MFKRLQQIIADLAALIESELELYKLQGLRLLSRTLAGGFAILFFMLFFIIIMILGGVAIGFVLSDVLGSYAAGFGLAVGAFVLLFLLLLLLRRPLLLRPFENLIIRFYLQKEQKADTEGKETTSAQANGEMSPSSNNDHAKP